MIIMRVRVTKSLCVISLRGIIAAEKERVCVCVQIKETKEKRIEEQKNLKIYAKRVVVMIIRGI